MLEKDLLAIVLDKALEKGGDFAEVYVEEKRTSNVLCEDDKIEKINSGREKGAGIRVVKDGKTAYVYTNDLTAEGLLKAATVANHAPFGYHRCSMAVANNVATGSKDRTGGMVINLSLQKPDFEMQFRRLPEQVDFAEKIEQVLAANHVARNMDAEIRQVTVALGDMHKQVQIANSEGELVEDELARVRLVVNAIASRDGQIQTGYEVAGAVSGWELLEEVSVEEMAGKAASRAIAMLSARPAPTGRMPVVMHADAGGTMIHEACGHGLEADLVQKGLSVYANKMGEQVAMEEVNVIDDATLLRKYGSFRWDDEGSPARRTVLIEKGVLRGYLYDRMTARKDGTESSGNGRRESYQDKPIPRMSNTFISPGPDEPDEIIKSTPRGLLVKKMGGGQVNTTNGDFVFDVQEGYIIEDGEIMYPVRGATLTGNGPRALIDIDRVGKDLGFAIGVCGKDGQGVAVADAQPTIRIKELTVGGTFSGEGPGIKRIRRK
ncbi:MAG: peptidase C69 [Firmicutes bacterium HGW-Firmicutes-15]|nr:MAG: peptidase C69 [Firmicutes bacterium HGW-Firmicutes-15]